MIEDKKITIEKEDLEKISSFNADEAQEKSDMISIREEYQYSTKVSLEDRAYEEMITLSKKILDQTKEIIEE